MTYPARSNFTTALPEDAWWENLATREVCSGVGVGLIVALQLVLQGALKPPWRGPDGVSHSTRPKVDGNWGPITAAALWAYAGMRGKEDRRGTVAVDISQKRISLASAVLALWLTYYTKRLVELPEGTGFVKREDPAILGATDIENIVIPEDAELWKWLQRPNVPGDLASFGAALPVCRPKLGGRDIGPGGVVPPFGTPPTSPPTSPPEVSKGDSGWGWIVLAGIGTAVVVVALKKKKGRRR